MWEDEENKRGGKWIVRLKKGVADRYWEDLLLAIVGDQFAEAGEEVCGAVLSVRSGEDVLSVWTRIDGGRNIKIRYAHVWVLAARANSATVKPLSVCWPSPQTPTLSGRATMTVSLSAPLSIRCAKRKVPEPGHMHQSGETRLWKSQLPTDPKHDHRSIGRLRGMRVSMTWKWVDICHQAEL